MAHMPTKPLCFVLMPFGKKADPAGGPDIDFDRIYAKALRPAIIDAGMEPIRADEERTGGVIHKPMFERLLLCDYAIADLTTANANVFYELGVRHTARPSTTLTIFATGQPIPFDVNFVRSMPYALGKKNSFRKSKAAALRKSVAEKLSDLRKLAVQSAPVDSPLFQLLGGWKPGDLARLKTDVFRERVQLDEERREQLDDIRATAKNKATRTQAHEMLKQFRAELGALDAAEIGTVIDLMLTHRALEDWDGMISVFDEMPITLQRQILVREQLAFAYNRRAAANKDPADRRKALRILKAVEKDQGASSETCGLIGRIHKDNWDDALKAGNTSEAAGHLNRAIDAYIRGFEADPRDAYPGVNAVTLLEIQGDEKALAQRDRYVPIVRYAVERRLEGAKPDYWDHATMLELAVLANDRERATAHLEDAMSLLRETWEAGTTARNLGLIADARRARGERTKWLDKIVRELSKGASGGHE